MLSQLHDGQIRTYLEHLFRDCGIDFTEYSPSHLRRRLHYYIHKYNCRTVEELLENCLRFKKLFNEVASQFTIGTTRMFRDPSFFQCLSHSVIPELSKMKTIKVWHAGCSSGEEVYSLAILLREHGLLDRCRIYATDIREDFLRKAKSGIYPIAKMKEYSRDYFAAGGCHSLSHYCTAKFKSVLIKDYLRQHVVFSRHNLVEDGVFGDMSLILCRNVTMYFNATLRSRVMDKLRSSLGAGGFLCLGKNEYMDEHSGLREVFPGMGICQNQSNERLL